MDYKTEARRLAENFRLTQGLGVKDPLDFRGLLDALNILAVFKPLSKGFSGMAGKIEDLKFMLINSAHSLGRQHFTVAHELYHLFYDEDMLGVVIDSDIDTEKAPAGMTEKRANAFASYLLLPEGFLDLIPRPEMKKNALSAATLVKIEQYYRCSRNALLVRLQEVKLVDEQFVTEYSTDIIKQAKMLGYNTALYKPGWDNTVVGDYAASAYKLFSRGIISESNFIQYMLDIGVDEGDLDFNEKNS